MSFCLYTVLEIISIYFMYLAGKCRKLPESKDKNNSRQKAILFFFLSYFFVLILFIFRSGRVGKDTSLYKYYFDRIMDNEPTAAEKSWLGSGFVYIFKFLGLSFNRNYLAVLALFNTITLLLFYLTFFRESDTPWLSLLIFFSFCLHYNIFNQFRQMLAIAITFYNFKNLKDRKLVKYLVICAIAAIFHKTALIMIPFYFIANTKISKKTVLAYCVVTVIAFLGFDYILYLVSVIPYTSRYITSSFISARSYSIAPFAVRLAMVIVCFYYCKRTIKYNNNSSMLYNLCLACLFFQVLALKSYIFSRIITYFSVYFILLIPRVLKAVTQKGKIKILNGKSSIYLPQKVVLALVVVAMFAYKTVYFHFPNGAKNGEYMNYSTFWLSYGIDIIETNA